MTPFSAYRIVQRHQRWRRGSECPKLNEEARAAGYPFRLGLAIDIILAEAAKSIPAAKRDIEKNAKKCKRGKKNAI